MRIRIFCSLALVAVVTGGTLLASGGQYAPGDLHGPVVGYALDANLQAIRPINGIPGSSILGDPVSLPFPIAAAGFSPRGDFALVISAADDRQANVLRNIGVENSLEPIEGAIASADKVVFNADGSTAALAASTTRQLQVVHGIPGMPSLGPAIDLSSIPGTISAIAVDQAGSNVLIAVSNDHGGLYLASDGDTVPRLIANFGSPAALALLNGDRDVIVADPAVNEVTLVRNFASAPEAFRLAGESDGISDPAGLQVSPDGRKLYIANGGSRSVVIWNFDAQSIEASYPLDAAPTRLTPLKGLSIFVLNEVGDHPLLLLDAVNTATYFVPAGKERN